MVGAALHVDAQICEQYAALRVAGLLGHALDMSSFDLRFGLVDQIFHRHGIIETVHKFLLENDQGNVHGFHSDICQRAEIFECFIMHGSLSGAHQFFITDDVLSMVGYSLQIVDDLDQSIQFVQMLG